MNNMKNKKSDVKAKEAFVRELVNRGFKANVVSTPADIKAEKDGETWYFEIKMTKRQDTYFGAATLTEWRQALLDPEHFRFVVAQTDEEEENFKFIEFDPAEFMGLSTIPPFKIFFNIDFGECRKKGVRDSKAVKMCQENFDILDEAFNSLKRG